MLVIHRTPFEKLLCGSPDFPEKIPPNIDIWYFNREMAAVNKCQHLARPAVSLSPLSMDGLRWRDKWHQMVDNFQIVLKRLWNVFYTGIPRFIAHCFVVLCAYCVFLNQWKVCGNPSSLLALFFQQHLLTSCLCHILVTLTYFKLFHYHDICYGDLWSASFDVTIVIGLGHQEPHPHKTMNLIKCCVCSHCSTDWLVPISHSLLRPPYSLRQQYWNEAS